MRRDARSPEVCDQCGSPFQPIRSGHRFCSRRCRVQWHRRATSTEVVAADPRLSQIVEVTEKELDRLGKRDTVLGAQALVLAQRLTSMKDTASSIAAASRELDRLMLRAAAGGSKQEDQLSAARRRRDEKRTRARQLHARPAPTGDGTQP